MWLVKGAPNLMQRLSRLPPVPNVTLLDRRKPKSLSWPHANTTFTQQTYIRWCCIDLSNAPSLLGNPDSLRQIPVRCPSGCEFEGHSVNLDDSIVFAVRCPPNHVLKGRSGR